VELAVGQPVVLPPGPGPKLLRDELTVSILGPNSATPHVHRRHADSFYVLEGAIEFAGKELPAGGFGLAPPHVVHWFVAEEARILNVHAPGRWWRHRFDGSTDNETIDNFDPPEGASEDRLVVLPGGGEPLEDEDRVLRIKAATPELCLFEFDAGPGYVGPPAHLHRQHVDAFYVLDGSLEVELDGDRHVAERDAFVAAPPGVVHTFRNAGAERVRFLNLHAPGMRFDEYLRRLNAGDAGGRRFHEAFDVYEVELS
jgi:quercetin dioxygenase-like cupin family protein